MKTDTYDKIEWSRQYRKPHKWKPPKSVIGWDTETIKGKPFLIYNSLGNWIQPESFDDCLKFLGSRPYRAKLNFWWNIEYDLNGMFKFLSDTQKEKLYYFKTLDYVDYNISFIPRRFMKIRRSGSTIKHYDLAQFYRMSLNLASRQYLNKKKLEVDVKRFNDAKYVEENRDKIKEYCLQDCVLTERLGVKMRDMFREMGNSFNNPVSMAKEGINWAHDYCNFPIGRNSERQKYAFRSYYGGRFEMVKRGYFEQVYRYDLNSAYPSELINLIDVNKGNWIRGKEDKEEYELGFLRTKIWIDHNNIEPLPFRYGIPVYFPVLEWNDYYMTLDEYRFIRDHNLANVKIKNGWFFVPYDYEYPFRPLKKLYDKRQELHNKNDPLELVLKIILNSIYGKSLQLTQKLKRMTGIENALEYRDIKINGDYETVKVNYRTGNYFNPVIGAIITARCRLKLLETALKNLGSIISFATDSITTTEKGLLSSSNKLGEWNYEGGGEMVIFGNGIYSLKDGDDCETKLRGVKANSDLNLFDLLEKFGDKTHINLETERVIKLGESLLHRKALPKNALNQFVRVTRQLSINADRKRKWNRNFKNCGDVLKNRICSEPLEFTQK